MMVSVTTAKTRVIYTMIVVNCYITNTFYVMNDLCSEFHPKRSCHCSSTTFQTRLFNRKMFQLAVVFFLILLIYFLRTPFGPREWACGLWINLLVYLFLSYLSHALLDFNETCTSLSLMHTLQVQLFSDLSCYLTLLQSILYTAE